MKKGEESRQRLIECAAELFWKNGYSATGISEILKQTDLPLSEQEISRRTEDFFRIPLTFLTEKPLNCVMPV